MTMPKVFAGMKVIGADGVPVGTVEGVAGGSRHVRSTGSSSILFRR
jgi:hypothetical protein